MIIANLFAGPGAGKSTTASKVFSNLKDLGINAELVSEFAKDMTWSNKNALACPPYIWGTQVWRVQRLLDQVDVIVTDCPTALCAAYTDRQYMYNAIIADFKSREEYNLNFFLNRTKKFSTKGRVHSLEESLDLDEEIRSNILRVNGFKFTEADGNTMGANIITEAITERLNNGI